MEIKITVNVSGVDPIEVKVDMPVEGEKEIRPKAGVNSVWFDESCLGWTKDPSCNKYFLIQQQNFFNEKLRATGDLFENEVRDYLGLPRTPHGQLAGWIWNPDDPDEQDEVDLGIFKEWNRDFINGLTDKALLDFNVRGDILKYL